MKITKVATVVVNANMRNWVFVKVETDQPGLIGWGEATLEWKTATVIGAVEDVSRFIIGEDPRRIEHLYQMMYRQFFWKVGIEGMTAISGIEQALWDIKGKWLNVPVYELLGGRVRDRVRVYNHLGGGTMTGMYESSEPQEFAERALSVKAMGYTALKFMAVPRTEPVEGVRSVKRAAMLVHRRALRPCARLLHSCDCRNANWRRTGFRQLQSGEGALLDGDTQWPSRSIPSPRHSHNRIGPYADARAAEFPARAICRRLDDVGDVRSGFRDVRVLTLAPVTPRA